MLREEHITIYDDDVMTDQFAKELMVKAAEAGPSAPTIEMMKDLNFLGKFEFNFDCQREEDKKVPRGRECRIKESFISELKFNKQRSRAIE